MEEETQEIKPVKPNASTSFERGLRSDNYPDLLVSHEIILDWCLDYLNKAADFPISVQIAAAVKLANHYTVKCLDELAERGYLCVRQKQRRVVGVGPKISDVRISVRDGNLLIGPFPRGVTPRAAQIAAHKIFHAAQKLIDGKKTKP